MLLQFDFPKTMNELLEESIPTEYQSARSSVPSMDITEIESEYLAILELPGVKKEDVKITFEKNVLTIEGKRTPYANPQEAQILLKEMAIRDFNRSIRIPVEIDASNISAELENGILKVVLPKSQQARVRTIAIK
ncbi:MAG: Hsp20/alpha crystallin family protein [Ignavibacteriales bacterium]|nr:Hsp20/alpha crystallin family protein [Ignavibacteriales bacterium]